MKKIVTGLLVSATVLGFALTTTSNVHAAETTDANNKATLQVDAGTLSMTTPASRDFGKTSVEAVYNANFDATATDTQGTTITDFLGDNKDQTVTVKASGWTDASMNADSASILTITPTVKGTAASAVTITKGQLANIATVNAGKTDVALEYGLHIAKGTPIAASTTDNPTTNTLTWSVGNVPATSAE